MSAKGGSGTGKTMAGLINDPLGDTMMTGISDTGAGSLEGAHTHTVSLNGVTLTIDDSVEADADESHENRPEYIIVAFIQYKG